MTLPKLPIVIIILSILLLVLAFIFMQPAQQFQLTVINESDSQVSYVRLIGTATESERIISDIDPGNASAMYASLTEQGELRFEVSQGGNRIDSIISDNVKNLERYHYQLTIYNDNRYIISEPTNQ